jgi:hypothetical protein
MLGDSPSPKGTSVSKGWSTTGRRCVPFLDAEHAGNGRNAGNGWKITEKKTLGKNGRTKTSMHLDWDDFLRGGREVEATNRINSPMGVKMIEIKMWE